MHSLDLQAMDLLRPGDDVKDMIVKSKIVRESYRIKVESDKRHKEDLEKKFLYYWC